MSIAEFFHDNDGSFSATRGICFMVSVGILFVYIWRTMHGDSNGLRETEVALLLGAMGLKVLQKPLESKMGGDVK